MFVALVHTIELHSPLEEDEPIKVEGESIGICNIVYGRLSCFIDLLFG